MSLWDKVSSWFAKDAEHFVAQAIPKDRVVVDPPPESSNDLPIIADRCYLRIWLADMFLAKSRDWFKDWQPAVQGRVKLQFADQAREFMRLAAPSSEKFKSGESVVSNYVLLDLVPFRGGTVELEVALLALEGKDRLASAISVVAGFADLVTPPLAGTLQVATKVKEGISTLFAASDEVHLAVHNTFGGTGGANELRPSYFAMIRGTDEDLDRTKLCVKNGKLCLGELANAKPLTGFDYMLLRFEVAATRNDFQHFSDIAKLRSDAIEAYLTGETQKGDTLVTSALVRIATHPDLINADRRALAKAVKEEIAEYKGGEHGATRGGPPEWAELVGGGRIKATADHSPMSMSELLDGL